MRLGLNFQWKLTLSFIAIIIFVVLFVYFLSNYYILQHFENFCEFYGKELPRCLSDEGGRRFVLAINKTLVWVGALGFVLAFLFGYFISKFFLRPIDEIVSSVRSFSKGNHKTRINQNYKDEMGDLAKSLNEMFMSLEKSEKLRRDLTANISHELATPLTNIYGYIEALADNVIKEKKEKERVFDLIKKESERLIILVRELKSLALLESDNFTPSLEEVEVNKLIADTLEGFEMKARKKGVVFKKEFDPDSGLIKLDPHKFQQALCNIIDNAVYYSPQGGEVRVRTKVKNDQLSVSVKDQGEGIKQEDLPFIFERFYQGDKSRSEKDRSIGIGLTIVKKIVESHQGKLEVFSKQGEGSEFIISLPRS